MMMAISALVKRKEEVKPSIISSLKKLSPCENAVFETNTVAHFNP
jgi:hypothetical protein